MSAIPYDEFFDLCDRAFKRHGDILDLTFCSSPYEYLKKIRSSECPSGRILDFGCGARKPTARALGLSEQEYKTCDTDPSGKFDWKTPSDIPEKELFEMVVANHVLEHIPFEPCFDIVATLAKHVKPGGIMFISVPNPKHPTRYLSSPVHVTPWNYLNLCALMELGGLDPFFCARTHKHKPPFILLRPFVNWICRTFMMDWCDSIFAVGRRAR